MFNDKTKVFRVFPLFRSRFRNINGVEIKVCKKTQDVDVTPDTENLYIFQNSAHYE